MPIPAAALQTPAAAALVTGSAAPGSARRGGAVGARGAVPQHNPKAVAVPSPPEPDMNRCPRGGMEMTMTKTTACSPPPVGLRPNPPAAGRQGARGRRHAAALAAVMALATSPAAVQSQSALFRTPLGQAPCVLVTEVRCWFEVVRTPSGETLLLPMNAVPGPAALAVVSGREATLPAGASLDVFGLEVTSAELFGAYPVNGRFAQYGDLQTNWSLAVLDAIYEQHAGTTRNSLAVVGSLPREGPRPPDLLHGQYVQWGGVHHASRLLFNPFAYAGISAENLAGEYLLRGGVLSTRHVKANVLEAWSVLRVDGGLLTTPQTTGIDRLVIENIDRLVVGSETGRQGELYLTQARFSNLGSLEVGVDGGRGTSVLQHTPVQAQTLRVGVDAAPGVQSLLSFNGGGSRVQVGSATVGQGTGGGGSLALASGAVLEVAGELRVGHGAAGTLELRGDSRLAAGSLSFGASALAYLWAAPEVSGLLSTAAGSRLEVRDSMRLAGEVLHEGLFAVDSGSTLRLGGTVRGGGSYSGHVVFEGAYTPGVLQGVDFGGGPVSFAEGAVLTLRIASLEFHDRLTGMGTLDFAGALHLDFGEGFSLDDGGTLALLGFDTLAVAWDPARITVSGFDLARLDLAGLAASGSLAVAAVPEPGSWALMAAGLLSVLGVANRRRRVAH